MSKIIILNGSPRKKGNTSELIKAFTRGAEEVGNTVTEFFFERYEYPRVFRLLRRRQRPAKPLRTKGRYAENLPRL